MPVIDKKIGHFEIGEVRPLTDGGNQKVKVKVRINLHGIFVVSSANYVEKHEVNSVCYLNLNFTKFCYFVPLFLENFLKMKYYLL